jgi:hypothetical protein
MRKMGDLTEIPSAEFISVFGKRSRATPAGEHPRAEEAEIKKKNSVALMQDHGHMVGIQSVSCARNTRQDEAKHGERVESSTSHAANCNLSEMEKTVYGVMSTELLDFDILWQRTGRDAGSLGAALLMLELKGLVKRAIGDRYSLSAPAVSLGPTRSCAGAKEAIKSFIQYVSSTFTGISRKYLQNYLGWYWCVVDRKRWSPGSLVAACLDLEKMSQEEIRQYSSPSMVKVSTDPDRFAA